VKDKGGINITNTVPLNMDMDEIKAVLSEYKVPRFALILCLLHAEPSQIANADIAIRQPDATPDDLIDVVEGNR
jgi:uncharacterized protein